MKRKAGYTTFILNIKDEFPLRMTTAHGMKTKSCVLNKAETKCLFKLLKAGYGESEALRSKRKGQISKTLIRELEQELVQEYSEFQFNGIEITDGFIGVDVTYNGKEEIVIIDPRDRKLSSVKQMAQFVLKSLKGGDNDEAH